MNFSKIRGDILKSRCTTGINNTGGKIAAGINDTGGKFATSINDTGSKFSTSFASVVETGGKFATCVNDTSGKFAAIVNDTWGNLPPASMTPAANNGNNIRLLRPQSELEGKNVSIS